MNNHHCIESAVFKVTYPSEELALDQQHGFEDFVKSKLLPTVEEVFDEVSDSEGVLWFDQIEVDLGDLSLACFHDDFQERLRQVLYSRLHEEIAGIEHDIASTGRRITRQQSELQVLCCFLESGRLPWNASPAHANDLDALFGRVLSENLHELINYLNSSPLQREVVFRLANQFSLDYISKLVIGVLRLSSTELRTVIEELCTLSARSFGLSTHSIQGRIWSELLRFGLRSRNRDGSPEKVILHVIQTIATFLPQHQSLVLRQLLQHARGQGQRNQLYQLLRAVAAEAESSGWMDTKIAAEHGGQGLLLEESLGDEGRKHQKAARYRARLIEAMQSGSIRKLKTVWLSLLSHHSDLLKSATLHYGQSARVRNVIAHKFEEPMIKDIVQVLEPANYGFIEELVSHPKLYMAAEDELAMEESEAKKSLWEFTLTYLIVDRGSRFNRKAYIASVMWQMAAHINVTVQDLYDSLMTLIEPASARNPLRGELMELLGELRDELPKGVKRLEGEALATSTVGSEEEAEDEEQGPGDAIGERELPLLSTSMRDALFLALDKAQISELKPFWESLMVQHTSWLLDTIRREGQRAEVRHNMAIGFSDPMLRDVVMLVEPVEAEFIYEIVTNRQLHDGIGKQSETSAAVAEELAWEFTLSYLLVERGNQFNRKSYLESLINQMAAHQNQSVELVLDTITDVLSRGVAGNRIGSNPLVMLQEIREYLFGGVQEDEPAVVADKGQGLHEVFGGELLREPNQREMHAKENSPEMEQLELIRAYLLYEKLVGLVAMADQLPVKESYQLVRLLHELIENYPWQLHRFNQDLNSGRLPLLAVLYRMPGALQKRLLLAFFDSFSSKYSFSAAEFSERVSALGRNTNTRSLDFATIFERLIGNKIPDIETIFAEKDSLSAKSWDEEKYLARSSSQENDDCPDFVSLNPAERQATPPLSMNDNTVELIRAYLLGHLNVKPHESVSIANTIELMLGSHSSTLLQLLADSLRDKAASDRLANILPESLLVKIMLLLRPADHFKVVLYADLLTMACVENARELAIDPILLHRLKWQFILDYLVIERRSFNEIAFVRSLCSYLRNRSAVLDGSVFREMLARNVMATSTATTHVACVRIVMILNSSEGVAGSQRRSEVMAREISHSEQDMWDSNREAVQKRHDADRDVYADATVQSRGFDENEDEPEILEDIYIENAGLVLLAPYLQRYFDSLNLIAERKFKDVESAERGVHLLQYVLNESTDSPEFQLVLNKILCGVKTGKPIVRSIEVSEQEKSLSDQMLLGVIGNWPALKNTSIAGLRESFLQREAQLQLQDDSWKLIVQSKAFDMLLDQLPWGYTTIKLPWMDRAIYVDWR